MRTEEGTGEKERLARPSHASPSHLHYIQCAPSMPFLLQIPLLSAGVRISRPGCLFARLCSREEAEDGTPRTRDPIWTTTKISIPLPKGLSRFAVSNVTEYRYYKAFSSSLTRSKDSRIRIYRCHHERALSAQRKGNVLSCASA